MHAQAHFQPATDLSRTPSPPPHPLVGQHSSDLRTLSIILAQARARKEIAKLGPPTPTALPRLK